MSRRGRLRLGLVVPSLAGSGGVQAVGRFLRNAALRSEDVALKLISLPESSRDPMSLRLASPASWFKGARVGQDESGGLPVWHAGAVMGELEFQRYRPRRALSEIVSNCDVIQVVCGTPAWGTSVVGLGKPVSMHVATLAREERRRRDARPSTPAAAWRKVMTSITARMDDRALQSVDAVQVMNPWMLEHARALNAGNGVDVRYLPPGVDTMAFHPGVRDRPRGSDVLCVGRFSDSRKNIGLLLEAFAKLPAELQQQARLVLVGAKPPAPFWQRAQALQLRERIVFVEQPDAQALLRLYQDAALFALPSDEEGFGMVLLEAMACGIPVVSTRSGGPEGIITDGEDGFLVPRDDAAALGARLEQLLSNPAEAADMGARARRTVEQRYDERVVGQSFVNLWHQLSPA